jgi:hypothetical protein
MMAAAEDKAREAHVGARKGGCRPATGRRSGGDSRGVGRGRHQAPGRTWALKGNGRWAGPIWGVAQYCSRGCTMEVGWPVNPVFQYFKSFLIFSN